MTPTIFALATAPGRAAVAVVRLSGPQSRTAIEALAGRAPPPRRAARRRLCDPATGAEIDEALILWMPGPRSFTGEDVAEVHLHGGPAVVSALLDALLAQGLSPAGPGAFTRRAFENGKLDLAQAEAVADLIDAETEAQRRQALAQLGGALTHRHLAWRAALLEVSALLEAEIDFPEDIEGRALITAARTRLAALRDELAASLSDSRGTQIRDGFRVALVGRPNAGKSSLFNALLNREAAIVTPIAGTTRDVIEAGLVMDGYKVWLSDTAGLRDTADPIEREGVRRAETEARAADLRLWVVDSEDPEGALGCASAGDLVALNKVDRATEAVVARLETDSRSSGLIPMKCRADVGDVAEVAACLRARVVGAMTGSEAPGITRERHRLDMREALTRIDAALDAPQAELMSEDLRLAARALERVLGRMDVEDVLDAVFAAFCIGK